MLRRKVTEVDSCEEAVMAPACSVAPPYSPRTRGMGDGVAASIGKLVRRTVTISSTDPAGTVAGKTEDATAAPVTTGVYRKSIVSCWSMRPHAAMRLMPTVDTAPRLPPGTLGVRNVTTPEFCTREEEGVGSIDSAMPKTMLPPVPAVTLTSCRMKAGRLRYDTVTSVPPDAGPSVGETTSAVGRSSALGSTHTSLPPSCHSHADEEGGASTMTFESAIRRESPQKAS
mmetsp:Transcript_31479/g.76144  ORF Transcript_31479/g.76144 Transcript_31479/m.76144 type:complete len:228 (-) Transcript_31479:1933-2616(-)